LARQQLPLLPEEALLLLQQGGKAFDEKVPIHQSELFLLLKEIGLCDESLDNTCDVQMSQQ